MSASYCLIINFVNFISSDSLPPTFLGHVFLLWALLPIYIYIAQQDILLEAALGVSWHN